MRCKRYERWAGLYIEGDLGERRARKLERHLETCPACRELVNGLEESQKALKELGRESVDPEVFQETRRRIRQAVGDAGAPEISIWPSVLPPRSGRYALAGATLVVLLGMALFYTMSSTPPLIEQKAEEAPIEVPRKLEPEVVELRGVPERVEPAEPPTVVSRIEPEEPEVVRADVPREEPAANDLVIKLVTDDPDIVIYWLVERNGG